MSDSLEKPQLVWPDKYDLIGVQVSNVNYDHAIECMIKAAKLSRPGIVACHAVHAIVTASCDDELRSQVNQFSMITPDGQPVRWGMNLLHGTAMKDRVYGLELTLRSVMLLQQGHCDLFAWWNAGNSITASANHFGKSRSLRSQAPKLHHFDCCRRRKPTGL